MIDPKDPRIPPGLVDAINAYDQRHKAFMARQHEVRGDLGGALDLLEEYFQLVRQVPGLDLESEKARVVRAWGEIICKGERRCISEFTRVVDDITALHDPPEFGTKLMVRTELQKWFLRQQRRQ